MTTQTTPKYALGIKNMLLHAIWSHTESDPEHRSPKRFELHPSLKKELMSDPEMAAVYRFIEDDCDKFNGVRLVWSIQATRAKMITADNKVEYL